MEDEIKIEEQSEEWQAGYRRGRDIWNGADYTDDEFEAMSDEYKAGLEYGFRHQSGGLVPM